MADSDRRDLRRVATPDAKRQGRPSLGGSSRSLNPSTPQHSFRRQSVGGSSPREPTCSSLNPPSPSPGRNGLKPPSPSPGRNALNPSSPSPGKGKRPQATQELAVAARPVQKKLKYDQELSLHVLLPNETSCKFILDAGSVESIDDLLLLIQANAAEQLEDRETVPSRTIEWGLNVWLEDHMGQKLSTDSLLIAISSAKSIGSLLLILQDGEPNSSHKDKNMWNVTPKPEMLGQLPQGYTLQTALADQVDNALQAVYHNQTGDRRLVSVTLRPDKITIFDTGQGMDGSTENCIANWGTVGGSTHRDVHHKGLGGKPPFLNPYLGKYGAGGVAAALHLGRRVTVWSKTKLSKWVTSLVLEQKALVARHKEDPQQRVWRTGGAFREMTEKEKRAAPHGSFTLVEISMLKSQYCIAENKQQYWTVDQIRQLLKDIYYPYIQSEEGQLSKTVFPVEFEVNGVDLVEIIDCETAISKMHTCNGEPFVFDIQMKRSLDALDREQGSALKAQVTEEANARVTCQYYPNQKGKEALETVLQELKKLRPQNALTFEAFHRVTIRWLGRLLPEVKWPIFPFMEVSSKKEQRSGVRRLWSKRVRAFVDTDAGFHPNQSKTELERDQPFAVALKGIGTEDFTGTSVFGVVVSIRHKGMTLKNSLLMDRFLEWLKEMHTNFDEECTFVDEPIYVFNHPNAMKELGVEKPVILFHKHMRDARGEHKVDDTNPLRVKVQKGANGLKSDLFATVEFFFQDGADDEHGEVKFLCRHIEVDETDGCRLIQGENRVFQLNKSLWFPASLLGTAKCQQLDAAVWRKKVEDVSNKSPSYVEILNDDDAKKLELCQMFPADNSTFEAGFSFPKEFLVVVRPKKGSGPTHKQGMIVAEPMTIELTVTHCSCRGACDNRRSSSSTGKEPAARPNQHHGRVVCKLSAQRTVSKGGVKGLYLFCVGSSVAMVTQGNYSFYISGETEKHKNVDPAVSSIQIIPSRITAKWTLCNHLDDCTIAHHNRVQPLAITIRLNEGFEGNLFLQKYDEYDNRQAFEKSMDLDVMVVTPRGESLQMTTEAQAHFVRVQKYRLHIKNMLFSSGSLTGGEQSHEGVLRVCCGDGQNVEIGCKVLPGALACVQVKDSKPLTSTGNICFQEALQPGEIIKRLAFQGLDAFGNKIEKGQKMHVLLEGLEFQDSNSVLREVDDYGCLQLGGLLKVTCHYNSSGSISITSGNAVRLCTINFTTVIRQLVAKQIPLRSYVGRHLQGCIQIVDEVGNIDTAVDGYSHSITVDWVKGVTYPFTNGECNLPDVKFPGKPGCWRGKVYFSANKSLNLTITVQLELAIGCRLGPAKRKTEILAAQCGLPFVVPFSVYDEENEPALLMEGMKRTISAKVEATDSGDRSHPIFKPCSVECKDVKMSRTAEIQGYEAHIVASGSIGTYTITLMDTCFQLKGHAESVFNLQPGNIARLVVQSDETHTRRPLSFLEATRCSPMPNLTVTLVDSENNVCSSCEERLLRMRIADCVDWKELVSEAVCGVGKFHSSSLVVPVGTYQVSVTLDSCPEDLYSLDDQSEPIEAHFLMKVNHGNYPSALSLLGPTEISVSLTEETIQYLPPMSVLVVSADGAKLKCRPNVGIKVHGGDSHALLHKEYFGTFMDTCELELDRFATQEDASLPTEAVRYEFTQVCAPSQAGTYVMEFLVRGTDVHPQTLRLTVKHGPPARMEIIQREPGQEMDVLHVSLVDAHGNICEDIFGLEVSVILALSNHFTFPVSPGLRQCAVLGKSATVVKGGKGDFGPFKLSRGLPGLYTLKVFETVRDGYMNPITPAEAQIFVTYGNISYTIQEQFARTQEAAQDTSKYLKHIRMGESMIQKSQAERKSLEEEIRKLEGELRMQESQKAAVTEKQEACHDQETLDAELRLPVRNEQSVLDDIRSWDRRGTSAARALVDAQSQGNFLSPQSEAPGAQEILGLVVTLARVESDALNRILSDFMGISTLLLIVCRTQLGVSVLEQHDEHGNPDDNSGLHEFARRHGRRLSGRYEILALSDLSPYRRSDGRPAVQTTHPQGILNMDPPLLPGGQMPMGFLGYAVNLLHLSSEQMKIRVATRKQGDSGLRESLFFDVLKFLQVYDTRQHMISAKQGLDKFGGAISLDGGVIRVNKRQQLGRCSEKFAIRFGLVPPQDRMMASLLAPACHAFQRSMEVDFITRSIRSKRDVLTLMRERLFSDVQELEHLEKTVRTTKTEQERIIESSKSITRQLDELTRAVHAIRARNDSGNSQAGDNERMRAFMM